jgi:protein SCO1/2
MLKTIRYVSVALALLLTAVIGIMFFMGDRARETLAPAAAIGGPFRLASASGGVVDSKDLAGKPFGVFFGFTHCPEVCPTTLFEITGVLKDMGEEGKDLRFFFVTVDPERDTASYLKDYIANFDPRIEALVPTAEELAAIAKQYRVIYEKVPTSDGSYTMNHTATVYLMGRDGQFVSTIAYGEDKASRLAKLKRLVAEG